MVVDQLVYPRVAERVRAWQPETERQPADAWLLPWFRVLGRAQCDALWALLSQKMAAVLRRAWTTPLDGSALAVLRPWKAVADARRFSSLLATDVVPKLRHALKTLNVHEQPPSEHAAELLAAVVRWADVLPPTTVAALLAADFFPRWLACERAWLHHKQQHAVGAVARWYRAWRALLPPAVVRCHTVQQQLAAALDMLDRAMDGKDVAVPTDVVVVVSSQQQQQEQAAAAAASGGQYNNSNNSSVGLREVLEQLAVREGVEFVPTRRAADGMTVYRFGRASVVLDARVVRVLEPASGKWRAVSLAELVESTKTSGLD